MRRHSHVEPLTVEHRRQEFACASDGLTAWFRRHALRAQQAATSKVYVVRRLSDDLVIGFYALAGGSVRRRDATERVLKGTGRYEEVPAIILTRLAVDRTEAGRGLGRALLKDGFHRVLRASEIVGIRVLLVHAETERARDWYMKIARFEQSPVDDRQLLLLMKDLRRSVSG